MRDISARFSSRRYHSEPSDVRKFEQQRRKRTFTGHAQLPARLLIAGIGGLVIGLFGNFGEGHTQTGELPFNLEVWSLAG